MVTFMVFGESLQFFGQKRLNKLQMKSHFFHNRDSGKLALEIYSKRVPSPFSINKFRYAMKAINLWKGLRCLTERIGFNDILVLLVIEKKIDQRHSFST